MHTAPPDGKQVPAVGRKKPGKVSLERWPLGDTLEIRRSCGK